MIEVAVLIVAFNGRACLGECLDSVLASQDGGIVRRVVVVDNASGDGSADWVAGNYPGVELLRLRENAGFAGGNNAGWEFLRRAHRGVKYIALLNQDTVVASGWLAKLVERLEGWPVTGAVQAKILLWPEKDRFNTAGNRSHYLGFGFTTAGGVVDRGQFDMVREIDFPSGAAMAVRVEAVGPELFDGEFFAYLEDADLGWKLRQRGYRIEYVPAAVVWHKYAFRDDFRHYFHLERNRWLLLLTYFKWRTLLLLLPAIAAMEAGQAFFAWRHGVLRLKIAAWGYFCRPGNLRHVLARRRLARKCRKVVDREFTEDFLGRIDAPELDGRLLKWIGNPLLAAYWRFARRIMWW